MPRPKPANPFSPGSPRPRCFVGRGALKAEFETSLAKWETGGTAPPLIIYGVPGVGKSALLNEFADMAMDRGWLVGTRQKLDTDINVRRAIGQVLGEVEAQLLGSRSLSHRVTDAIASFKELRLSLGFGPVSIGATAARTEAASTGSLGQELTRLFVEMAEMIGDLRVVFFLDEIQLLGRDSLRALMYALDEIQNREDPETSRKSPIAMVAAGLPQTKALCRAAGRYAERFNYQMIERLSEEETLRAFRETAQMAGDDFADGAARLGYELTDGYPQFIQVYGEAAWLCGEDSPISLRDMISIQPLARERLHNGFFATRLEEASPPEQDVLFAMARLSERFGEQAHRVSDVAREMGEEPGPTAQFFVSLATKGLLQQARGPYAFTVPRFTEYLIEVQRDLGVAA